MNKLKNSYGKYDDIPNNGYSVYYNIGNTILLDNDSIKN